MVYVNVKNVFLLKSAPFKKIGRGVPFKTWVTLPNYLGELVTTWVSSFLGELSDIQITSLNNTGSIEPRIVVQ